MPPSPELVHGPWGARPAAPGATSAGRHVAHTGVAFTGSRKDYARLMAWGLLLYIPTFGFYRFWLKTEQRRYLWSHTSLDGDAFEYRGTMRELVVGFLFAVAIYMPIAAAYSLAGLVAESYQSYASLPFAVFTVAFTHFAAFRARRYRLTRTGFRGLRFWMWGSGWRMGFAAFGWLILTALTMGIAYLWMQAWLERYKMEHSRYGNLHGRFDGTGWGLFKATAIPTALIGLGAILLMVWTGASIMGMFVTGSSAGLGWVALLAPVAILFVAVAWSVLSVVKTRWWLGGIRFGEVALASTLRPMAMAGAAIKTALMVMVVIGLWAAAGAGLAFGVAAIRPPQALDLVSSDLAAIVALMGWMFVALLLAMFIKAVFYNFDFIQRVAATTTVDHGSALDAVRAEGTAQGVVGEGLADALGADGF